jgi:transcriptional regulator GlxA family with amidase domain
MFRPNRLKASPAQALTVYRLPDGAELLLSGTETALLVVRGACTIRARSGKLERVSAGAVLLHQQGARKSSDRAISRAIALMQAEPAKRWTVERLARAVGLSRAAFARRFVASNGHPPQRFLTELRLALAAAILIEREDASLAEIAGQVGYVSEFAFSRAFKRHHGVAPGQFRRLRALPGAQITMLAAA